jgi:hypothetical protein
MSDGVLTPAYGRTYLRANDLFVDWSKNKDFVFLNPSSRWNGSYINKSNAEKFGLSSFTARYRGNTMVCLLTRLPNGWSLNHDEDTLMYAHNCTLSEVKGLPDMIRLTGKCVVLKVDHSVVVPKAELQRWLNGEGHIQDVMPNVSKHDREFLISGASPEGWKKLWNKTNHNQSSD